MPPSQPSHQRPTIEQTLSRVPSFGYQYYFASPEAPNELLEIAELWLAGSLSPKHRRAVREAGGVATGQDMGKWTRFGEMQRKVHKLIVAKRAGEARPAVEGDEVSPST